ncbi:MAG: type III pantothenate kinase [Lachnospiraceae bacterium]|nr:type III pantothenate kinase [Lachnospiraceae bacterium]
MLLAVDIGNTNLVVGVLDQGEIRFFERVSTDLSKTALEYALCFKNILELHSLSSAEIDGAILASVVPPLTSLITEALGKICSCRVRTVGPGLKNGLKIHMDDPAQIGADLIVGAVAGIHDYTCPLIIIDMGTATTISVIDDRKTYSGGMILPGLRVSLDSLTSRTSKLPRIGLDPPKQLIGKNTIDCMKSGILYGTASMLDGMIERIEDELGMKATIIATGGLASTVVSLMKNDVILDDDLLLRGLYYIYEKNK